MTATNRTDAERLIVEFLATHDNPTSDDWKALADKHPEHASAFVDAALVRAVGDATDASGEPYEFDADLATRMVSKGLSRLHQTSSAQLELAQQRVKAVRTPAQKRELATKVGIGEHVPLLAGVLVGRTFAPRKVLNAISEALEVPSIALRELFSRLFEASTVPAFKASEGKPTVPAAPASWEEAVRGLRLDSKETERLLRLADES
jgi:hypothetical protein